MAGSAGLINNHLGPGVFKVEKKDYGLKIVIKGSLNEEEMKELFSEAGVLITESGNKFSVLVDAKEQVPIEKNARDLLAITHMMFYKLGMKKLAVIYSNSELTNLYKEHAIANDVEQFERYLDFSADPDALIKGEEWLRGGIQT